VWRRAHDRFRRAVDRYHDVLERVPAEGPRASLEGTGAGLAAALDTVHAVCVRAQSLAPSTGDDVPGGHGGVLLDVHRALTRSATLAAQAAEAVTLTVVALRAEPESVSGTRRTGDEAEARAAAAARAGDQARAHVGRAEALLASVDTRREG
jgi:hypothetical protein